MTKKLFFIKSAVIFLLAGSIASSLADIENPKTKWFKGCIHAHTLWSDGQDYPEWFAVYYKEHGYNFVSFTDHNITQQGAKWVDEKELLSKRCAERFGADWIESRELEGKKQVKLKTLNEFRHLFEEPGKFMFISGEEITPARGHVNVINSTERLGVKDESGNDTQILQTNIDWIREHEKQANQPMIATVNHPNWQWFIQTEDILPLTGQVFVEIYNAANGCKNFGDENRVSMERMWDILLAMRLGVLDLPIIYGTATDDTHGWYDSAGPGRGWVVVRSAYLTPNHIVNAMKAGDFYASSGVGLKDVQFDGSTLTVEVEPEADVSFTIRFIGTKKGFDTSTQEKTFKDADKDCTLLVYSDEIGTVLKEVKANKAQYSLTGDELYVRATIISSKLKERPHVPGEFERAWTQPFVPRESR
ncbi:MAG TPA: hypothetical protein PLP05_08025 [Sedimentisphaerales bacterium]|nr:hypothetical protein [Sedimentisphaerales bacterium]